MVELPALAKMLRGRFPDIGRFDLIPHAPASFMEEPKPPGLTLHLVGWIADAERIQRIGMQVEHDLEFRALGINDVYFTLWGDQEGW